MKYIGFYSDAAMWCPRCVDGGHVADGATTDTEHGLMHGIGAPRSDDPDAWGMAHAIATGAIEATRRGEPIVPIWSWEGQCGDVCDRCLEPLEDPCQDEACSFCAGRTDYECVVSPWR